MSLSETAFRLSISDLANQANRSGRQSAFTDWLSGKDLTPTKNGGYTKAQLASLGVPWPPPKGWKKKLIKARAIGQGGRGCVAEHLNRRAE